MKLISMTDFVLQEKTGGQQVNSITSQLYYELRIIKKYADFLKQPLKLEMFVPCDDNGNVLEEPEKYGWLQNVGSRNSYATEQECIDCETFHLAKQKVLFDGFDIYSNGDLHNAFVTFESSRLEIMNVENLITDFQYSFYLTPNAIKRIFG